MDVFRLNSIEESASFFTVGGEGVFVENSTRNTPPPATRGFKPSPRSSIAQQSFQLHARDQAIYSNVCQPRALVANRSRQPHNSARRAACCDPDVLANAREGWTLRPHSRPLPLITSRLRVDTQFTRIPEHGFSIAASRPLALFLSAQPFAHTSSSNHNSTTREHRVCCAQCSIGHPHSSRRPGNICTHARAAAANNIVCWGEQARRVSTFVRVQWTQQHNSVSIVRANLHTREQFHPICTSKHKHWLALGGRETALSTSASGHCGAGRLW